MVGNKLARAGMKGVDRMGRFTMACMTAVALVVSSPAVAALSGEALELVEEAQEFLAKGDVKAAIIQLKNAVRGEPDNPELRLELGKAYLVARQPVSAEKELRTAIRNGIDPLLVQVPLAEALVSQRKFKEVLSDTSPDGLSDIDRSRLQTYQGESRLGLDEVIVAEELAMSAVKLAPDFARGNILLASVHVRQGRIEDAEKVIDTFLASYDPTPRMLYSKAELRKEARDFEKSFEYYGKSLELDPLYVPSLTARAHLHLNQKENEEAVDDINAVLEIAPNYVMGKYLKALYLFRKKEYEEADDYLVSAGDALMTYPPALFLNASNKFALNELEQAQKFIDQYLGTIPENPAALGVLGGIQLRRGEVLRAVETLERAYHIAPDNFAVLVLLGNTYIVAGQFAQASEMFDQARAIDPDNPSLKTQAAISKLGQGLRDEAIAELGSLVVEGENVERAGFALVLTHVRAREYDQALSVVDDIAKTMTKSPLPDYFRGNIHRLIGNSAEAHRHYAMVAEQYPDFVPVRLNQASLYIEEGDLDMSASELQVLLNRNPKDTGAILMMARISELKADNLEAERWLNRAVDFEPQQPQHQFEMVRFLLRAGRPDDALKWAKDFAGDFPDQPLAYDAWAQSAMAMRDPAEGLVAMRRLVRLVPDNASVQFNYGLILHRNEDKEGAIKAMQRALEINPDLKQAKSRLLDLILDTRGVDDALALASDLGAGDTSIGLEMVKADLLFKAEKYDQALPLYLELLEKEPNPVLVSKYFNGLKSTGKGDQAMKWLREWVKANITDTESRMLFALNLMLEDKMEEAAAQYSQLTREIPDNPVPWNNLAWIYGHLGKDNALDIAKEAYQKAPKSALVADTYAWLLFKNGKIEESLDILKRAYVTVNNNAEITYHLAAVMHASGDTENARKLLKKALASESQFVEREDAKELYSKIN